MDVLARISAFALIVGGALGSAFAYPSMPVACSTGLLVGLSATWMLQRWPAPKPIYIPGMYRPNAQSLRQQRWFIGIAGGSVILAGLTAALLLPKIAPGIWLVNFFQPTQASFAGQGAGFIIFAWITAPRAVAEHNAWLARMGANFLDE